MTDLVESVERLICECSGGSKTRSFEEIKESEAGKEKLKADEVEVEQEMYVTELFRFCQSCFYSDPFFAFLVFQASFLLTLLRQLGLRSHLTLST